jgi:hypothetical protein
MKRFQDDKEVTDSPEAWRDTDRIHYTVHEALEMLPSGNTANVKVNNVAGMIVGADWTKANLLKVMMNARLIEASGPIAAGTGFGLHVLAEDGSRYFVETRNATDAAKGGE